MNHGIVRVNTQESESVVSGDPGVTLSQNSQDDKLLDQPSVNVQTSERISEDSLKSPIRDKIHPSRKDDKSTTASTFSMSCLCKAGATQSQHHREYAIPAHRVPAANNADPTSTHTGNSLDGGYLPDDGHLVRLKLHENITVESSTNDGTVEAIKVSMTIECWRGVSSYLGGIGLHFMELHSNSDKVYQNGQDLELYRIEQDRASSPLVASWTLSPSKTIEFDISISWNASQIVVSIYEEAV
ncbi:hypothetical protein EC991_001831 [Linnemannia zychae]|nr:hypothetical protein EC991_001831 [Linnemannia zychae]